MASKDLFSSLNPLDTISNLFNAGYSIYQDQRNYKYQKQLQQDMFARDDNAMQRRMIDYQKAGINPLMALGGSGAGVTSAGTGAGANINVDTEFFSNQEKKKLEREYVKDEMDKRQYEKDLMKVQIKSGKIANLSALQDFNTKQLEYKILQNQLLNMEYNDYYPSSSWGKLISDISQIANNNLPFSMAKPLPGLFNILSRYIKDGKIQIDPSWIDKLNNAQDGVENFFEGINEKAQKTVDNANLQKAYQNQFIKRSAASDVIKQFNKWNKNKNIELHFLPQYFNGKGVLKLYSKRLKKYYSPNFFNFESINRFLNYGNVKY